MFALLDAETDLTYTMYIHDPNYLLMAGNPLVFRRIYIGIFPQQSLNLMLKHTIDHHKTAEYEDDLKVVFKQIH